MQGSTSKSVGGTRRKDSRRRRFNHQGVPLDLNEHAGYSLRKLTEDDPSGVEAITAQERIRRAYEVGILQNSWDKWWEFRDDRAATSHGYNKDRAIEIVAKIPAFYTEVDHLAAKLQAFYAS